MSDNMSDHRNNMNDYHWLCKFYGEKVKGDGALETVEQQLHWEDMSRRFSEEQRKVLRGYD